MKTTKYLVSIIFWLATVISCTKTYNPLQKHEMEVEILPSDIYDTVYRIANLTITSSDDDVLRRGKVMIKDENDEVLAADDWQLIRNSLLALPERRKYTLSFGLYRSEDSTRFLAEGQVVVDNIKYPKAIQLLSCTMNSNVINNATDGSGAIASNVHSVRAQIRNSISFSNPPTSSGVSYYEYVNDMDIVYLLKSYAPKTITFNFSNVILPFRTFHKKYFKDYEMTFYYPLALGATFWMNRQVIFSLNMKKMMDEIGELSGVVYTIPSSDSSEGGIYTGTLNFQWIYE
jgi:hypothetical protein